MKCKGQLQAYKAVASVKLQVGAKALENVAAALCIRL